MDAIGPLIDTIHIKSKLHIRDLKFVYNMIISENKLAQSCFSVACSDANSIIGNKIAYFRSQFCISVEHDNLQASLKAQLKFVRKCNSLSIISCH